MSKESLEQTLQPYVEKLLQGIEKGVEFAGENIPDILRQYVLFEAVQAWIIVIFCGLILPYTLYSISKRIVKLNDDSFHYIYNVFSVFFMIPVTFNISTAIKATFFSKLFLVETFLKLI